MFPVLDLPPAARRRQAALSTGNQRLPQDLQEQIYSFLPLESVSRISRSGEESLRYFRIHSHYPEIQSSPTNTLIGRLFQIEPGVSTESEKEQLVKRVRRSAVAILEREKKILKPESWKELGISPQSKVFTLSYAQMNQLDAAIRQRKNDELLVESFKQIITDEFLIRLSISRLPRDWDEPSKAAKMIRDWFANPSNQWVINRVNSLWNGVCAPKGLPVEFLQFLNIPTEDMLTRAASDPLDDPETIYRILESRGPVDSEILISPLEAAIEAGNLLIGLTIARSRQGIELPMYFTSDELLAPKFSELLREMILHHQPDPVWLGYMLKRLVRNQSHELVELVINSPHVVTPAALDTACLIAAETGTTSILRSILRSPRQLPDGAADRILSHALAHKSPAAANEVLMSKHIVLPLGLRDGFKLSLRNGYFEMAKRIIEYPGTNMAALLFIIDQLNEHNGTQLREALFSCILEKYFDEKDDQRLSFLLRYARRLNPHQLGWLLLRAIELNEPATIRMAQEIAQSRHLIHPDVAERAYIEASKKEHFDLSRKISNHIPLLRLIITDLLLWTKS